MVVRPLKPRWRRRGRGAVTISAPLLVIAGAFLFHYFGPFPLRLGVRPSTPAPLAGWPWPRASRQSPAPGVTHWLDHSSPDGTAVEFFDFNFADNPNLRLELYDQGQTPQPATERTHFWARGVGQVTRELNTRGNGRILAAWNGPMFQYDHVGAQGIARHLAPIVLDGQVYDNVSLLRWAVGVKYMHDTPFFSAIYHADSAALARNFDFATEGATCLLNDAHPLALHSFPRPGEDPTPPSSDAGPRDPGFIHLVDHMRTSRTSMGWSPDNRHLYLLVVKAPESATASRLALRFRLPLLGGWTVADEQRFWLALGVDGAVNLDGGDATQMACLRPDGRYDLVPPRWAHLATRLTFAADFNGAPAGGTLMYFYVREQSSTAP